LIIVAGYERTHVTVYDNSKASAQVVYRGVLNISGVEYDAQTKFEWRHEGRMHRIFRLSKKVADTLREHCNDIDWLSRLLQRCLGYPLDHEVPEGS
jgi:hypothetical protein